MRRQEIDGWREKPLTRDCIFPLRIQFPLTALDPQKLCGRISGDPELPSAPSAEVYSAANSTFPQHLSLNPLKWPPTVVLRM
jgi:hypothetical protein